MVLGGFRSFRVLVTTNGKMESSSLRLIKGFGLFNHRSPRLTVCVTYGFHNMRRYRERMRRSLGLGIC